MRAPTHEGGPYCTILYTLLGGLVAPDAPKHLDILQTEPQYPSMLIS